MLHNETKQVAKEILKNIDSLIELAKANTYEKHLTTYDVEKLNILRDAIEKQANGNNVNFNVELDIPAPNPYYRALNTYLKIATSKCNAEVVEYLLQNGAKPTKDLIYYPIQYQSHDLQNVLKVLKNNGVDINPKCILWNDNYSLYYPHDKGHSLLFWAQRKNHKDVADALTHNDAQMSTADLLALPGAKLKDNVERVLEYVVKPAP